MAENLLIQLDLDPPCATEPFAKVHAPEARRHAHVMTTTDVRKKLDFAIDFDQLLHGDVDFGQGLTETRPPTRHNNMQR